MADWRTTLTARASFRGAQFLVETDELESSQRQVKHRYPFRDDAPYIEPTGKDGDVFTIEGFVIGDEFIAARDKLIKALSKSEPGELVHPSYGTKRVMPGTWRIKQSQKEGGWARFTIDFAETSSPVQPAATTDGAAAVTSSAAVAKAATASEFLSKFSEAASVARDAVGGALSSAAGAVGSVMSRIDMATQTVATLQRNISNLTHAANSIAASASDMVDAVNGLVDTLADGLIAAGPANPVAAILSLYAFNPGPRPAGDTVDKQLEQVNFDATQRLVQRLVVVKAATIAITQTFGSYDDAVRVRDSITALIDDQADIASDDTFPPLQQLRADLVLAVPGIGSDLPKLLPYTPPATVPSLVLTQRLYGNLDREEDLITRNRVAHPGFVPGATQLEILSDG